MTEQTTRTPPPGSIGALPNGATNHPALAATHWWDHCNMEPATNERHTALAPLAAAFYVGGPAALIAAARGQTRNGYVARAWALAMTAEHGPTGVHPDHAQHPEVLRAKAKADRTLREYLGV